MDNQIVKGADGSTTFVGFDATKLFQATVMRSSLKMLKVGIKPNAMYTMTNVLRTAGNITGKTYKRGQADQAIADLTAWIAVASAAIPVVEEGATA